jgi:hypothetical protein
MKLTFVIWLLLPLAICGCHFGVQIKEFEPAQAPEGVEIKLVLQPNTVQGNRIAGELLEVRDDGLLLNVAMGGKDSSRVVFAPYAVIISGDVAQVGREIIKRLKVLSTSSRRESKRDERVRNRVRLVSRFPQGVSPELMTTLLSAQGQEAVDVLSQQVRSPSP